MRWQWDLWGAYSDMGGCFSQLVWEEEVGRHGGTSLCWCLQKMSELQTYTKTVGWFEEMPVLTK